MREQEEVDIFDGEGGLYRCQVSKAHQRRAQIRVVEQIVSIERPDQAPSLAMALLKGQAMDRAIAQAMSLAYSRFGYCRRIEAIFLSKESAWTKK